MERNKRPEKKIMTLEEYFAKIEELLRLTGRQWPAPRLIDAKKFNAKL